MSETESTGKTGMSTTTKILIGALVAIIVIAVCAIAAVVLLNRPDEVEPTAIAPATEPATSTSAVDDSWDRVKASGLIVVGTSADYPPFEFYIGPGQVYGFDIALMDEIGRRLGVKIQYMDYAFDGLGNALQLRQIDAAIAAISITPERESEVDFSNVYMVGTDGVLARQGAGRNVSSIADLAGARVGVQRGSVYEDWLYTELVETGRMPEGNLLVYERAADAVRDLQDGRVDLVVMDLQPAEVAVFSGGVELVAQGLNQQRYALALPKGAQALKAEIDRVLNDLHNEGVIALLAMEYLGMDQLLPTPTPRPGASSTPRPTPECVDSLTFVEHLTQEGDMAPGQPFTKGWRVINSGTCTWDTNYLVAYVSGDRMGGQPTPVNRQVAPGDTYDIQVNLVAPLQPGTYASFWQMRNGQGSAPSTGSGQAFGQRLQVAINVPAGPTVTPAPTQTPAPGIIFTVDRNKIKAGECVNFYWKVENVKEVYFYAEGENWQNNGVTGEGTRKECPPVTWAYYLRVVKLDGTVETPSITIYVEPVAGAPVIKRFTVDPPGQIILGECVNIQWKVAGDVETVAITANDSVIWEPAPSSGSTRDCPVAAGTVAYGIVAVGPGGTSNGSQTIRVVEPVEPATPVPTLPPAPTVPPEPTDPPEATIPPEPTDKPEPTVPPEQPTATEEPPQIAPPVIRAFAVTPPQIQAGESVGIRWAVSGGTTYARILRNGVVIMDNVSLIGKAVDKLAEPGSYVYQLEALNPVGESVSAQQTVTVTELEASPTGN